MEAVTFVKVNTSTKLIFSIRYLAFVFFTLTQAQCAGTKSVKLDVPDTQSQRISGSAFYHTAAAYNWQQRDSFAVQEILSGNLPYFLLKLVPVHSQIKDSAGNNHTAVFYVTPDYLSVGTNADWARIPLTPMAAQQIADKFQCFLPTRKMVDLIYGQSVIKLEPVPMYAFRDSTVTMWQHHLIIEGQRKNRKGLIAGIKKDVVISGKLLKEEKQNRVAIYGWHQLNGKPIQPLYTGHVNWYVDYSHGIRLISRSVIVDGKKMDYIDVLKNPLYHQLLCDEEN